jgi:hypothetical protein
MGSPRKLKRGVEDRMGHHRPAFERAPAAREALGCDAAWIHRFAEKKRAEPSTCVTGR